MQHRFVAKTLALSISLLSLPFAYAKEDKVQQLEEVVISGSKEGTSIKPLSGSCPPPETAVKL